MRLLFGLIVVGVLGSSAAVCDEPETLPPLREGATPSDFDSMWAGFDPRAEPLETKVLKEWEEEGVALRIVQIRIGVFKGRKATLAAIYGYPKDAGAEQRVPGLVQIHGGGQYAHHRACLLNAKRGYATVSIAWAGRISAPDYQVSPAEVKLFWDGKTDDPRYRVTTDWGAVDGYHAPGRNAGNVFPSAKPAAWTLDTVESPRNSGWFLCALAARRALTFLERQPEVDPDRLGVYGHSMGGKLTVMASVDDRVKSAAPSCGGISDRDNDSPLFRSTIGDDISLKEVSCPIIFLSPANDFHGRIGDLPKAIDEIESTDWRVTCSPHHNHQDTAPYEVATLLWFDQHLQKSFEFPRTPATTLKLDGTDGVPVFTVTPDASKPILAVDVYYTQQGRPNESPGDMENTMHRFWHHAEATEADGVWRAALPLSSTHEPLWVYANVRYPLDEAVTGAGYYYGTYEANSFNLSSLLTMTTPDQLRDAKVQATLEPSLLIEDFADGWEHEWFTYRTEEWARTTNKLYDPRWHAPPKARLALRVRAEQANRLVLAIDDYATEVELAGGPQWQNVDLEPADFRNAADEPLPGWEGIRSLKLTHSETLRPGRGSDAKSRRVGGNWKGPDPVFRDLRWHEVHCLLDLPRDPRPRVDYVWTTDHVHVGVRWQPFVGQPGNNAYDATRPVLANDSSYAQFWVSWGAIETMPANTDYVKSPTASLQEIERAVDVCNARGLKVEFVFFHCPAWASESGRSGGFKPKPGLFAEYVRRIATHFKGRVHAYQLSHEANLQGLMHGADVDFMIDDILLAGGRAVRSVYDAEPAAPVIVSTTGMSPCEGCAAREGLNAGGARAVDHFYDLMIANRPLMETVDALNLNISDHANGYGNMDGKIIPNVWTQYDLVRGKLDAAEYRSKAVLSAESWIVWDDASMAVDVNGDGVKDERDAHAKAVTIIGQCLQRGLNTINLPWSDNSSSWAMGLTKRRDYNGRVKSLRPEIVVPANDGGPDIVAAKLGIRGGDDNFTLVDGSGHLWTVDNYANPSDPNHVHYYVWKWYAQIAGGSDEVIRHAVAGEEGNDITVTGPGFAGEERYRVSSWNRSRQHFTVLVHSGGADGTAAATISIPSRIRTGRHSNTGLTPHDFRGEGFANGDTYYARVITKEISSEDGSDVDPVCFETPTAVVENETLIVTVPRMNRFTAIEFVRRETGTSEAN